MRELGQAGRSLFLEELHNFSGLLNGFPPFDHPLIPSAPFKIIEWLSATCSIEPKLLQSGVWTILHLALVLLSRTPSRTWIFHAESFPFCPQTHLDNSGLQISS